MATLEETIVTALASTGEPVYPLSVPSDGSYPCSVYQVISNVPVRTHSENAMERARVQISCWGKTYKQAKDLSASVKTALDLNKVNFILATKETEFDDKETESNLYRKLLDFFVWF